MAKDGDLDAQFLFGTRKRTPKVGTNGKKMEADLNGALKWMTKAAKQGHGFAMNGLSMMYMTGETDLHPKKAEELGVEWYRKGAELGVTQSQLGLAQAYAQGLGGMPVNLTLAGHWMMEAAKQGNRQAMNLLGLSDEAIAEIHQEL